VIWHLFLLKIKNKEGVGRFKKQSPQDRTKISLSEQGKKNTG